MVTISAVLTTSGTSRAVRIPRVALEQSKLGEELVLTVREGEIIIRNRNPRDGWGEKISTLIETNGEPSAEFHGMSSPEVEGAAWTGVSYAEWKRAQKKGVTQKIS